MSKHVNRSITVEGLSKSFGRHKVINQVDLQFSSGDIALISGRNGSGKTTLLSILGNVTVPDKGFIRYCRDGVNIDKDLIPNNIGYVSHRAFLYQGLTVLENLVFFSKLYSIQDTESVIRQKLCILDVQDQMNKRVHTLSHGQRKRISIVRSLLHSPKILIMDEPETGLDHESVSLFRDYIVSFVSTGGIAVIASHTGEIDYGANKQQYLISKGKLSKGC